MQSTTPQAPISATHLSRQFGIIVLALSEFVAHRFLGNPKLAPLICPVWTRLMHYIRRFKRLMALLEAGTPPKPRPPRPHRERPERPEAEPPAEPPIPTTRAWLVRVLGYEAAGCASQLQALLDQPGVAELLAQVPTARRILNPLGRLLGMGPHDPNRRRRPVKPPPPPPPPPLELGEIVARGPGIIMRLVKTPPLRTA